MLETFLQDLRFGFRQLLKSPVLLAVAVISLALGIGANTAIFTLINAVTLQTLPVKDPASLVLLYDGISTGESDGNVVADEVAYPFYQQLRSHNKSFDDVAAFRQSNDDVTMHVTGEPEKKVTYAQVHLVAGNYFHLLGVGAAIGRVLNDNDDARTSAPAAMMSYDFWKNHFQLAPNVVGKTISLGGVPFTVVGVASPSFFGERIHKAPAFWLPLSSQPALWKGKSFLDANNVFWLNFFGRLKPGVSRESAAAEATGLLHGYYLSLAGSHPSADDRNKIKRVRLKLVAGSGGISGLRYLYSKPLRVLMAVVALVLLIACANLATLLLARASTRRQEFLCRMALGAPRARLLRQVLTESVLLSAIGGIAGALFAWWAVKTLTLILHFDTVVKVRPDPAVLSFTFLISILTGILFGIIPAWKFSRLDLRPANASQQSWRARRFSSTQMLIALQVALSLCLLIGAGLLAHSLLALEQQNLGYARDHILLTRTDAELAGYQPPQYDALYRELSERINQLPGITSASIARFSPISGYSSSGNFSIEGQPQKNKQMDVWALSVGPRFFDTLKIPLLLGRAINDRDTAASTPVAIVNQTFVNDYLAGENPLGQHMHSGAPYKAPGFEIVGVAADSKFYDLREPAKPMVFYAMAQQPESGFEIILRTAADPNAVAGEVRQALKQINSRLPITDQNTLDGQIEHSLRQQKMITSLTSIFGLIALLLAAVGIYGTLAYSVAGRTSEIGIRMAIGAQRTQVVRLILRDLIFVLFVGLAIGIPVGAAASNWLRSFLFGVKPLDPVAMAAAILVIGFIALLAGYLPARRAAKIDPMRALRHE